MSCIVPWCREKKQENCDIYFFNLPKTLSRRNKWLTYACVKDMPRGHNALFCSKHFDDKWFRNTAMGKVLHYDAVPNIPPSHGEWAPKIKKTGKAQKPKRRGRKKKEAKKEGGAEVEGFSNFTNFDDTNVCTNDGEESEMLIESVKKQLCRICGRKRVTLTPVFEKCKKDGVPLVEKIEMHLPLKIKKDDHLPQSVCYSCDTMVQSWYDFHVTCLAADAALRRMFEPSSDLYDDNISIIQEGFEKQEHCGLLYQENLDVSPLEIQKVESSGNELKSKGNIYLQDLNESLEESGLMEGKFFSDKDFEHTEFKTLCSFCNEEFNTFQTLKDHKILCRSRFTVCEFCGLSVQVRYLKTHISKVHEKNMLCEICGDFFSWYKLKSHSSECVLGPTSYCEPCGRLFYSEEAFRSHIDGHERGLVQTLEIEINATITSDDAMEYLCPVCEDGFRDKLSVIEHLNSYKITICKNCSMEFRNERSYVAHKCKLTPKVWQCKCCFKSFKRKETLQFHEQIHIGVKPFGCKICGEKFPSKSSLTQHVLTHGPVTFSCPYCHKKFKRKATLRLHVRYHEGFVYKCRKCRKQFLSYQKLWSHRLNCQVNMTPVEKCNAGEKNVQVEILEDGEKPIKLVVQRISDEETSK